MNPDIRISPAVAVIGEKRRFRLLARRAEGKATLDGATALALRVKVSGETYELDAATIEKDAQGLVTELQPDCKGEWTLTISTEPGRQVDTKVSFFVVLPGWRHLHAYRGDLHLHTTYSDGRQLPRTMALCARQLGMDFLAITDHDVYCDCQALQEQCSGSGLGLLLIPGEEVTVPRPGGHILSIAASASVADRRNEPGHKREIASIMEELKLRHLVPGLTRELYAEVLWTIRTIHELDGKAYLAHPYWVSRDCFHLYRPIYEQLLQESELDGIELLGDVTHEDNMLSLARYRDTLVEGKAIPIVGNSDAHHEHHTVGQYYSIVFTPQLETGTLLDGVAALRSVVCQRMPTGELNIFGPFPWVEFAYFLEREYFPTHDGFCRLQAELAERERPGSTPPGTCAQTVSEALRQEENLFWRGVP